MKKALPSVEQITELLEKYPWIKSVPSLMKRFHYSYENDKDARPLFMRALDQFRSKDKSSRKKSGSFSASLKFKEERLKKKTGLLALEIQGYDEEGNFVAKKMPSLMTPATSEPPFFLIHRHQHPLLKIGDQVMARPLKSNRVEIIRKLGQGLKTVVGVAQATSSSIRISPCNRRDKREWSFSKQSVKTLKDGDVVVLELNDMQNEPAIAKILGNKEDPKIIPWIGIYSHGIPYEFSPEHFEEANNDTLPPLEDRQDLRALNFVTIDGEDAKDFDDAVWAEPDLSEKNPDGWHIIVAIADVSWYVQPNSSLDKEARRRGNSVYLPETVIPMLPEALSNGACSLKPEVDRACLAAHLWISKTGTLLNYTFKKVLINSKKRFTYTEVQKIYDNREDHFLKQEILHLYGAFKSLLKARLKRGALDLEMTEYAVSLAKDGEVKDIYSKLRLESHHLIEEMMICANVAAAKMLEGHKAICMYRIHEPPDDSKVSALLDFTKNHLKLPFQTKKTSFEPQDFKNILEKVQSSPHQEMVNELILRCQSQARYSPENKGHFGLHLGNYAHFTSPIRRYADLLVHRAITAVLDKTKIEYDLHEFFQIGNEISLCERRAVMAERDTLERYVCRYLEKNPQEIFEGRISTIARFGVFVVLSDLGATAILPVELLKGNPLKYNEKKQSLVGKSRSYHLGDRLKVKIVDVNPISASISVSMV
jgi:ribonuclease R